MNEILNVDKLESIQVLEFYVNRNIHDVSPTYVFNLGLEFKYAFNLLKTYFYDTESLSAMELEKIPNYLKLFELCNISEEILRMSKEDLLDKMDIKYYKLTDNTQVLNDEK